MLVDELPWGNTHLTRHFTLDAAVPAKNRKWLHIERVNENKFCIWENTNKSWETRTNKVWRYWTDIDLLTAECILQELWKR